MISSETMYTLTWDLVEAVARLYRSDSHEELVGSMNQVQHGIGLEESVNVHKRKEDELFLLVAAIYNETGLRGCDG